MDSEIFGHDTVSVTNSSTLLTRAAAAPNGHVADFAIITIEDADLRFWLDGTAPTASVGHLAPSGSTLRLESAAEVAGFRGIRTAGSNATLYVSYGRKV